jgi:uncharacterized protein
VAVELMREWYATLGRGDLEGALAKLDPEIEWVEAESSPYGRPGPIRGREQVLQAVWSPLQGDWERIAVEPDELIGLPTGVLALVRYRGVHRRTGARLDAQAAHIWDVEGERITRYRGLADTHALRVATGSDADRNRELAREEFEVWSSGELDRLDRLVASDVVHHDPYDPWAADGLRGLKASIRATRERLSDFEITVLDQVAEADRVASRWRATMSADQGAAGTREVSVTGITIERFANGKVVESWRSIDRLGLFRALGAPE